MKISEALSLIDDLKHNTYSDADKIRWLSELDGRIKEDIVDTHEDAELVSFTGYDVDTDRSTELIAKAPHDDIYIKYLEAKIDYANGESGKYNNSIIAFNDVYSAFRNYYNRKHMPLETSLKFF